MNNLPKSIFISSYSMLAFAGLIVGTLGLWSYGIASLAHLGLLLCALPINLLLIILFTTNTARTDANLISFSILLFSGLVLSAYTFYSGDSEISIFLSSMLIVIGWIAYVRWYSTFGDRSVNEALLGKGKKLPVFQLEDETGKAVRSDSFKGKRNIIMFYRGNWCPLCMAQIKELAAMYKDLEERNVQTILISPQPHKHTRALAKKFNLGFQFLVDKESEAAKQLGILAKNGLPLGMQVFGYDNDTLMPTVVLTDEKGEILYSDLTTNYRIRPEPEDFLKVFDRV